MSYRRITGPLVCGRRYRRANGYITKLRGCDDASAGFLWSDDNRQYHRDHNGRWLSPGYPSALDLVTEACPRKVARKKTRPAKKPHKKSLKKTQVDSLARLLFLQAQMNISSYEKLIELFPKRANEFKWHAREIIAHLKVNK